MRKKLQEHVKNTKTVFSLEWVFGAAHAVDLNDCAVSEPLVG